MLKKKIRKCCQNFEKKNCFGKKKVLLNESRVVTSWGCPKFFKSTF